MMSLLMITRLLLLACGLLVAGPVSIAAAAPAAPLAQASPRPVGRVTHFIVTVPQDNAELVINGQPIVGAGKSRRYTTPPLEAGGHEYTFLVTWAPNSYTTMTRSRTVVFLAGARVTVDLAEEGPDDRVRVIYVPTPADVAEEMVKLARVTADDVVYEPGCGDARILIAAVRGGAKLGVGVDIDPERVEESRANVKAAGLQDRIEIRLGDALDVKNLSAATVVLLYMGDHFNLLIRPILWRELPVGARVVSHRFLMGDWQPDTTITVISDEDGGTYDLHLWTVTEEVKRRVQGR